MATKYQWGENPFQDLLINFLLADQDILEKRLKKEINNIFIDFLQNILNDPEDALYLDFDIKKKKDGYKVIGKNFISALWLSGVFISNVEDVFEMNELIIGNVRYTYNKKLFELKLSTLTEKETKELSNRMKK